MSNRWLLTTVSFAICAVVVIPQTRADITSGLVAYYPFNGNANDTSGNGNNGTGNLVTLTQDRFGNANSAYHFTNDVNSEVSVPNSSSLNLGTNFTVSLWFKYDQSWSFHEENLASQFQLSGFQGWLLYVDQNDSAYGTGNYSIGFQAGYDSNTDLVPQATDTVSYSFITNWNHVVGVCDGTELYLYLNGVLVNQVPASDVSDSSLNLIIGGSVNPVSGAYNRDIDDVSIYNRALSPSDVSQLYSVESVPEPTTLVLVCVGLGGVSVFRRKLKRT